MNKTGIKRFLRRIGFTPGTEFEPLLCSNCFRDQGLMFDAARIGVADSSRCPSCRSTSGIKLDKARILMLADRFFVRGTLARFEFGGAPRVVFNEMRPESERLRGEIDVPPWLVNDVELIEEAAGIGFFDYGPRAWMLGDVEPLIELRDASKGD